MASKHPRQYGSPFVARFCGGVRQKENHLSNRVPAEAQRKRVRWEEDKRQRASFAAGGEARDSSSAWTTASIAFVWSAATPLPRLPHDFRAEARTHFIYDLEETT